jgi:hypothetical protein
MKRSFFLSFFLCVSVFIAFPKPALAVTSSQLVPVSFYSRAFQSIYTSSGSGDIGGTSSVMFRAAYATCSIRVMYQNAWTGGSTTSLSPITLTSAIQTTPDSGAPVQLKFGGSTSAIVLQPGTTVYSDLYTVPGCLTANQFFIIRTFVTVPSGGSFPRDTLAGYGGFEISGYTGTAGSNYVQNATQTPANANGSNQLLTSGATTAWSSDNGAGGGSGLGMFGPIAVVGYTTATAPLPVVALVGDSIMTGATESLDYEGGAAVRGMVSDGFTWYMVAHYGETLNGVYTGAAYGPRLQQVQQATVIIDEYGTNDLNGGVTAATLESQSLLFWALLGAKGIPIIPVTLIPRVTPGCPASSQTVNSHLAAYESYNAWLRAPSSAGAGLSATFDAAAIGVTIPTIIDPASYVESDSANDVPGGPAAPLTSGYNWCGNNNATSYSQDGTHPNTAGALLEKPAFTSTALINIINGTKPVIGGYYFLY